MIVLDTTVLVSALGDDHALRDSARALLAAAADGALRATTTPEAIQEFAHVRARRATGPRQRRWREATPICSARCSK